MTFAFGVRVGDWGSKSKIICVLWFGDRLVVAPMSDMYECTQVRGVTDTVGRDDGPWRRIKAEGKYVAWYFERGSAACESWAAEREVAVGGMPMQQALHERLQAYLAGDDIAGEDAWALEWNSEYDRMLPGE